MAGLKKQGMDNGTAVAFMVSTPENGVDSIALTYSFFDPIMTVMRPVAGFVSGIVAGVLETLSQGISSVHQSKAIGQHGAQYGSYFRGPQLAQGNLAKARIIFHELLSGQKYAFGTLFNDLAKWYLLGIFLAGSVGYFVPDGSLANIFESGILSYLAMLVMGLPIYVCATFSTPVAAAMVSKGLSPGAALVFLLAGPATNLATISMLTGLMGKRTVVVYIFSILICSLGFAYLTDFIYSALNVNPVSGINIIRTGLMPEWVEIVSAIGVLGLSLRAIFSRKSKSSG